MTSKSLDERRKKIRKKLAEFVERHHLEGKLSPKIAERWVYLSRKDDALQGVNAYHKKCFRYLDGIKNIDEMNEALHIFNDVWNYFPHMALGGKSPVEVMEQHQKTQDIKRSESTAEMPKIICGGREFSWHDYWEMARECERMQKPFRAWVQKTLLPKYRKFLTQQFKDRQSIENNFHVADLFFERALNLGFVDFDHIHARFVWDEFPHWWQMHVLGDDQSENQIRASLVLLSQFLEIALNRQLPVRSLGRRRI